MVWYCFSLEAGMQSRVREEINCVSIKM